jgi:hypothetical protein
VLVVTRGVASIHSEVSSTSFHNEFDYSEKSPYVLVVKVGFNVWGDPEVAFLFGTSLVSMARLGFCLYFKRIT